MQKTIKSCQKCALCTNQSPLLDTVSGGASVFWAGLSAVRVNNVETSTPLSSDTNTGKLIAQIEQECYGVTFYKTNIVKCLPLEKDRIRYPSQNEMKSCYPNFRLEVKDMKPKLIFLLGGLVAGFISKELNIKIDKLDDAFQYKAIVVQGVTIIPIHHPSYILVYKRKQLDAYVKSVSQIIKRTIGSQYSEAIEEEKSFQKEGVENEKKSLSLV